MLACSAPAVTAANSAVSPHNLHRNTMISSVFYALSGGAAARHGSACKRSITGTGSPRDLGSMVALSDSSNNDHLLCGVATIGGRLVFGLATAPAGHIFAAPPMPATSAL
jgi:hypothetical protein